MLEATFSPAFSTDSLLVWLALQASLDQTGNPPEVIASELALGPISRVQAKVPMFWIVSVRRGLAPTGYVEESVVADTPMLVSGHRFEGSGAAAVVGLAAADAPDVGAALGALVTAGLAFDPELERPATSHHRAASTVSTTSTTAMRRTQYTDGGSGPLGVITPLTMDTVVAAPSGHATIHSWRVHRRKSAA